MCSGEQILAPKVFGEFLTASSLLHVKAKAQQYIEMELMYTASGGEEINSAFNYTVLVHIIHSKLVGIKLTIQQPSLLLLQVAI